MRLEKRLKWKRRLRVAGLVVFGLLAIRALMWHTENDIREAAYRYEFANGYHNARSCKVNFIALAYGISLDNGPYVPVLASPFLLRRFRNDHLPVKRAWKSEYSEQYNQIADKVTGKTGAIFYTGMIRWISRDTVKVEAGYYEGRMSASGNIYTLKRRNGKWVVISDKCCWIS